MVNDVITIMVYRESVPEPDMAIESEHGLDHILTNFLLISPDDDIIQVKNKFPQYSDYEYIMTI